MSKASATAYRALRARLRPVRAAGRSARGYAHWLAAEARWAAAQLRPMDGWRPHPLGAPLIVSLTSHPPRFPTLALTLKTLLTQTVRPDSIYLWLTPEEHAQLPPDVRSLSGVTIKHAPALGPFKKIIPALERFPGAFIAIADDDAYYHASWLEELVAAYDPLRREIPCHRALRIKLLRSGVAPYAHWAAYDHPAASAMTLATGIGGVLYPPYSLHGDVLNKELFLRLCPTSDDLWLYWMARRAGWRFYKVGRRQEFTCWPGSQRVSLSTENRPQSGGNDRQWAALAAQFGWPRPESGDAPMLTFRAA